MPDPTRTGLASRRKLCGLLPVTFWLSVTLIAVVVIAAAVGGGVGGTIAHKNSVELAAAQGHISKSSAPTASSSDFGPDAATVTTTVAIPTATSDCNQTRGQNWVSPATSLQYTRLCSTNLPQLQASWRQNYFVAVTSTFESCIQTCDSYNYWLTTKNITTANYNSQGVDAEAPGSCTSGCSIIMPMMGRKRSLVC
jgi:hypothetical protein